MAIKGILFDFDGTLADTMHNHFLAWESAFREFGIKIDKNTYYPLEGKRLIEIAEILAEKYGVAKTQAERIKKLKINHAANGEKPKLYQGVEELIDKLKSRNIKIGIVTASIKSFLEQKVDKDFLDKFDVILTSDMYEKGKPAPDPYIQGRKELGIENDECIVIENAPLGIKSAKAAGMYCIAIESTLDKTHLTEADLIVEKFQDLFQTESIKQILK
ncbi:MAG: HAD family phosphatase [Nanoarchaeota archaeon]|nr:HAD family phosphatase [Nanoarchaeota archaeon]